MSNNDTAGIGDPYWYEWSIGLLNVIDMINPDNKIESVTLQATNAQGLDDVVVSYLNGDKKYYQVKHTRTDDTITFGYLVSKDDKGKSLLKSLAKAWKEVKEEGNKINPILYTNRKYGTKTTTVKDEKGNKFKRPLLDEFWKKVKQQIHKAKSIDQVNMGEDWDGAWTEWLDQLSVLNGPNEKLEFLQLFQLQVEQPSLQEIETSLITKLAEVFAVNQNKAKTILPSLYHALKDWSTTIRGKQEFINVEMVYDKLSLSSDNTIGNHKLVTPEPFFPSRIKLIEDLTWELQNGTKKVVFLSGSPGIGKTSVVNYLANRHDPVIDLRYHAYHPITPSTVTLPTDAGRMTKPEVLWGDLLTQLREFFKGRLSKNKVPIRNDFLTTDELRSNVLRLADVLGKERGKRTIITIDGIDHAARVEHNQHSFLDSLIPPDGIPDSVCFFIVGQPVEDYENYPLWLRDADEDISRWKVTGVETEDIHIMLEDISFPTTEIKQALRLIDYIANGNTLSAIFAIHEAKQTKDIELLQKILEERKLHVGISAYYDQIWTSSVSEIEKTIPFVGFRIASCLTLSSERINGTDLRGIFSDIPILTDDWNDLLRSLSPLIVGDETGFRVTHNDVRVHLSKQTKIQQRRLKNVASSMADYYWFNSNKKIARHNDLFKLLQISDRELDKAKVFTSDFVLEAIAIDRPKTELMEQCKQALLVVSKTKNWKIIHSLSCAITTLTQYVRTIEMTEREYGFTTGVAPVLFSEGHVPNVTSWSLETVNNTIEDSLRLIKLGELNRATGILRRWFHDLTLVDLLGILPNKEKMEENGRIKKSVQDVFAQLGKASQYSGIFWEKESINVESMTRNERLVVVAFFSGYLDEAASLGGKMVWSRALNQTPTFFWNTMEDCLDNLASNMKWEEVSYTLSYLKERVEHCPGTFQIKAATYSLLTGKKELSTLWYKPIKQEGYQLIEENRFDLNQKIYMYCLVSFTKGWIDPNVQSGTIANEATQYFFKQGGDSRQKEHITVLNNLSAILGNWFRILFTKGMEAVKVFINEGQIERMLEALIGKKRQPVNIVYGGNEVSKDIIRLIVFLAEKLGSTHNKTVYDYIKNYCRNYPVNFMLPIGWRYLADHGEYDFLRGWFDYWNGEKGKVWKEEIWFRLNAIDDFLMLAEEAGFKDEVNKLSEKAKYGRIGFSSNKETALQKPLMWFQQLVKYNPNHWKSEGKLLLEISQEISRVGDNALERDINEEIVNSAVNSGVSDIYWLYNTLNIDVPLIENPIDLVNALINMIEKNSFTDTELLELWAFGTGALSWQNNRHHSYIVNLKNVIVKNCSNPLSESMINIAPTEFYLSYEEVGYNNPSMRDYKQSKEKILDIVSTLSLNEAIPELSRHQEMNDVYAKSYIWKGVEILAKRVRREKPSGYEQKVEDLISILSERDNHYAWSSDGIDKAYREIIKIVRDDKKIEILDEMIKGCDFDDDYYSWLRSLGENIELLCLYRAQSLGEKTLKEGLQYLLVTTKSWIEGFGFLPQIEKITIPNKDDCDVPSSWGVFLSNYLFDLLKTDNGTRIQAALKGLWGIAQINPTALKFIENRFDELHLRAKEWILLLAEHAARTIPTSYSPFREVVLKCYYSEDVSLKYEALNILTSLSETAGDTIPKWELKKHSLHDTIESLSTGNETGILSIPSLYQGSVYSVIGIQTVNSVLQLLGAATLDDLHDLEKRFSAYTKIIDEEDDYKLRKVKKEHGIIKIILSPEMKLLKDIIYYYLSDGRWANIPKVRMAQALTTSVDPFILLKSPYPVPSKENWLVDDGLSKIIEDKSKLTEQFVPVINSGVDEEEMVLGAILFSYTRDNDIRFIYDTTIETSKTILKRQQSLSSFNGRAFAFYDVDRYDPQDEPNYYFSMTYESGGIGDFVHQNILCYPSHIWTTVFSWEPKKDNPLIWCDDSGNEIVRFEYFHGPIRELIRDRFERQPFMQRWVIKKGFFEEALRKFNLVFDTNTTAKIDYLHTQS